MAKPNAHIRLATPKDAEALLEIYRPHIETSSASFEYDVPRVGEFAKRITDVLTFAPWLVCEVDGEIAGYAYASRHRDREAYKWSVEVSVYIAEEFRRQGIARHLYATLFKMLADAGFHNAYAGVTLPNEGSVALHESMGFTLVGVYHSIGYKFGQWHDVGWWQKGLLPYTDHPRPPRFDVEAIKGV